MHPYLSDNKLRKEEKLLNKGQFDVVFEKGRSAGNKRIVMHWLANELGHPRLGLVVSTRFGNAVQRNRFKRRVREIFRTHKNEIGARDVVVLPSKRPESRESTYEELADSFLKLLTRIEG
ncbi:MAG: ribonuclease P protein component [Planctomycetes bacterium]|nr:ribonuclease P protein component [Planctomycetota bacterium]